MTWVNFKDFMGLKCSVVAEQVVSVSERDFITVNNESPKGTKIEFIGGHNELYVKESIDIVKQRLKASLESVL